MKINLVSNQSFGRLKITTNGDADAKSAREMYACSCPFERWEKIDKLSGKTPVEIKFYPSIDGADHETAFMSCEIGEETFMRPRRILDPAYFQQLLDSIEGELHRQHNIETARKYFA